jgi:hypothetical protein
VLFQLSQNVLGVFSDEVALPPYSGPELLPDDFARGSGGAHPVGLVQPDHALPRGQHVLSAVGRACQACPRGSAW